MKELIAKIDLTRLQRDLVYDFDLDKNSEWLRELLAEMCENSDLDADEAIEQSTISLKGTLKKTNVPTFQDVTLMEYTFSANYATQSVNELKHMLQTLEYEASVCFLHDSYQSDEAYKEETELFVENKMYELYFSEKGKANVQAAIHEQTFLNYDYYPKSE